MKDDELRMRFGASVWLGSQDITDWVMGWVVETTVANENEEERQETDRVARRLLGEVFGSGGGYTPLTIEQRIKGGRIAYQRWHDTVQWEMEHDAEMKADYDSVVYVVGLRGTLRITGRV